MQDKSDGKQQGRSGGAGSGASDQRPESGTAAGKTGQASSPRKAQPPRTAALTFPQPVRKDALAADMRKPGGGKDAPKPKSEPADKAARSRAAAANKLQPADPMALMMPFMKAGVAYSNSMLTTQIKLYDMAMQATPLGAMARQQARYNKMMTQAMFQMTPWGGWGRKT